MKRNTIGFIYSPNKNSAIKAYSLDSKLLVINKLDKGERVIIPKHNK